MNTKQTKIALDKINALYQTMNYDGIISKIEKDLMLSYVRQLYEAVLMADDFTTPNSATKIEVENIPLKLEEPKIEIKAVVVEEKMPVVEKEPIIKEQESNFEIKVQSEPRPVFTEKIFEAPEKKEVQSKEMYQSKQDAKPGPVMVDIVEQPHQSNSHNHHQHIRLFEEKKSTDLSDKLGETKIADITRAMGLNDRILTANQLFNGSQDLFQQTLQQINELDSFEDAKNVLKKYANQFNWERDEDSTEQAEWFIRLVKRRFK
jgi:hypothetical protein